MHFLIYSVFGSFPYQRDERLLHPRAGLAQALDGDISFV
jgi:hypothetical protein